MSSCLAKSPYHVSVIGAAAFIGLSLVGYWMYGIYIHAPPTTPTNPADTGNHANNDGVDVDGYRGELDDFDGIELQVCADSFFLFPIDSLDVTNKCICICSLCPLLFSLSHSHDPLYMYTYLYLFVHLFFAIYNRIGKMKKGWHDRLFHRHREGDEGSGKYHWDPG